MMNFRNLGAVERERERERESYTLLNNSKVSFCDLINNIKNNLSIDYLCAFFVYI